MSGHTPGPLSVRDAIPTETPSLLMTFPAGFVIEARGGVVVAIVTMFESGAVAQANARLIAAAPELLEAAQAILRFHSTHMVGLPLCIDGQPIDHTLLNIAVEIAASAVRKAEGHEP